MRVHVTISLEQEIYQQYNELQRGERSSLVNGLLAEYFYGIDTVKEKELSKKEIVKKPKETGLAKKDTEIDDVIAYWTEVTGLPIRSKVALNRANAKTLLRRHSMEEIQQLINGVALAHKDPYAPRKAKCANIVDLQMNENELLVWGKMLSSQQETKHQEVVKI